MEHDCKCTKEAEIAGIVERLANLLELVREHHRTLYGNGREGLDDRTKGIEGALKTLEKAIMELDREIISLRDRMQPLENDKEGRDKADKRRWELYLILIPQALYFGSEAVIQIMNRWFVLAIVCMVGLAGCSSWQPSRELTVIEAGGLRYVRVHETSHLPWVPGAGALAIEDHGSTGTLRAETNKSTIDHLGSAAAGVIGGWMLRP